ncbi:MAG: NAD(P)H-dependent oxidoreductase subunit E [Acidimicrobiales bacterium]|jgi:NADH-quinone oxidoreductase subunit E|tara:strand:- start:196 stop:810 length:615 start_codon:yes stop_codon:yes gene_type:complete
MPRLSESNLRIAHEIISRYPRAKSALIPLLHLSQEQDGYVADDAMKHLAELLDLTPAEVLGTCSFYEMFKREPVGDYRINICHGIACHLLGADDLIHHAEESLGVRQGTVTGDGISIEGVECIAACTEAPCLQVNYRYMNKVDNAGFDALVDGIRDGSVSVPKHGTLALTRQSISEDKAAGNSMVESNDPPAWWPEPAAAEGGN